MSVGLLIFLALPVLFGCGDDQISSQDIVADINNDSSTAMDVVESEDTFSEQTVFMDYTEDEKTVSYVDLTRYLGKWYEIATYESPFQMGCTGSTATYAVGQDDNVSVTNECFLESLDGEYKVDTARAEIVNSATNAELLVYFAESFGADYWIIELDGQNSEAPYEWAVVGSSISIFMWILSRTPQMENDRLNMILERLEERGYDTDSLSFTPQPDE